MSKVTVLQVAEMIALGLSPSQIDGVTRILNVAGSSFDRSTAFRPDPATMHAIMAPFLTSDGKLSGAKEKISSTHPTLDRSGISAFTLAYLYGKSKSDFALSPRAKLIYDALSALLPASAPPEAPKPSKPKATLVKAPKA